MTSSDDTPDLRSAYALQTPDDSKALYRSWAATYDATFADAMGYAAPTRIAALFDGRWQGGGCILDVGCGTGLVAEALTARPVDGLDISAEMLAVAAGKDIYGRLIEGDLTARLKIPDQTYSGLISAGTFTHGHVGPEALDELTRIAAPGALFVFGINAEVFRELDFGAKLTALEGAEKISNVELVEGRIYEDGAEHTTADDRFLAAVFRKPT